MKRNYILYCAAFAAALSFTSCEDSKSYSDLLREEEEATNWFLADQKIVPYVPADSVFETGSDAPFYKMDEDGYVYMQVVNAGDMSKRPEKGETVYYRYRFRSIKDMYNGIDAPWYGNMDNLEILSANFFYGNTQLTSTVSQGDGIQIPLGYLGYDSEVNLVIKSPEGPTSNQTECIPFEYNIKYFKAEY